MLLPFLFVKFGVVGQISNQYRRGRVARPVKFCTKLAGAETTPLHTRLESAIIFQRRRPSTIQYYLLSIICKGENLCPTHPNLPELKIFPNFFQIPLDIFFMLYYNVTTIIMD